MKRNKISVVVIGLALISLSCSASPIDPGYEDVLISKDLLADKFGDDNGTTSRDELEFLNSFFSTSLEAWTLGGYPDQYWGKNEIPFSAVLDILTAIGIGKPHRSEAELRKALEGQGILTTSVGVYVFSIDLAGVDMIRIKHFFRSSGGYVGEHEWTEIKIIPDSEFYASDL